MNLAQPRSAGVAGFTLLELLISLALLGLLATLVLPLAQMEVKRLREQRLASSLREIRLAIDAYKLAYDQGRIEHKVNATGYPETLDVLANGVVDARDPDRKKIYFLRAVPRDAMSTDGALPGAATWSNRSYASEPTEPREGADVYDVHSRSNEIGLNGIPYSRW
jgi:general secretion pathway protein G